MKCSNGEEINLSLRKTATNGFDALVQVQSVGDSYPSYQFKNITSKASKNAPTVYAVKGFSLSVHHQVALPTEVGILNVPSLGIKNEMLDCELK